MRGVKSVLIPYSLVKAISRLTRLLLFYGTHSNPKNNIIAFTCLGGDRDRILYLQYLSGIVYGIQEEDGPEPENPPSAVLHTRVLPGLLPDYESDA